MQFIKSLMGGGKRLVKNNPFFFKFAISIRHRILILKNRRFNTFNLLQIGKVNRDIIGSKNSITLNEGCRVNNILIRIRGNNNSLIIDKNCVFGDGCSIWMEGNGINIRIGAGSTFVTRCHINAQENGASIEIGQDCMFSNHIIVRTSDSHPIYDHTSGERINMPKPIVIGNHVWIAPNTKIMKGSIIPDNCIVGSDTTVTKIFNESNSLIVGRPAKVVRTNVSWTREKLF